VPDIADCVLFQHNVETTIFERHARHGRTPLHRWFFGDQARRMREYEGRMCRDAQHVIAVSALDAQRMREMFQIDRVSDVATGVDVDYFRPPADRRPEIDFVFVGSMDWLPNSEGVVWFAREILPLIRQRKPDCRVAIVGRQPGPEVLALAAADPGIQVTGTVPDVRPYLWNAKVSILPLRVGGGTRLKVYEAMAAGLPLVSTTVGVEGLMGEPGRDLLIADSPADFADRCVELLDDPTRARQMGDAAFQMVEKHCSWESVSLHFEEMMAAAGPRTGSHR
jgi:glycosyltransferase involved in cell wall biosynthesis